MIFVLIALVFAAALLVPAVLGKAPKFIFLGMAVAIGLALYGNLIH